MSSIPNIVRKILPGTDFQTILLGTIKLKDFFENTFPRITDVLANALDISKNTGVKSYVRFDSLQKYGLSTIQDLRLLCDGLEGVETIDQAMTSIEQQLEELKEAPLSDIDPNAIYASLIRPLKDFSKGKHVQDWTIKGIDFGDLKERYSKQLEVLTQLAPYLAQETEREAQDTRFTTNRRSLDLGKE
jgi:hypothetical protein